MNKTNLKTTKVKVKIPKIKVTSDGRKYIILKRRKVYLASNITHEQLIKFILRKVLPKLNKKAVLKVSDNKSKRTLSISGSNSNIPAVLSSSVTNSSNILDKVHKNSLNMELNAQKTKSMLSDAELKNKLSNQTLNAETDRKIKEQELKNTQLLLDTEKKNTKLFLEGIKNNVKNTVSENFNQKISFDGVEMTFQDLINSGMKQLKNERDAKKKAQSEVIKIKGVNLDKERQLIKSSSESLQLLNEKLQDDVNAKYTTFMQNNTWASLGTLLKFNNIPVPKSTEERLAKARENGLIEAEDVIKEKIAKQDFKGQLDYIQTIKDNIAKSKKELQNIKPEDIPLPDSDEEKSDDDDDSELIGSGKKKYERGLFEDEINKLMHNYFKSTSFLKTISRDEIPSLLKKVKIPMTSFIINSQNRNRDGEHWIAILIDTNHKTVEYYDSFADPLLDGIIDDLKPMIKKLAGKEYFQFKENKIPDQHKDTNTCGYHSMRFILDRESGKTFKEATQFNKKGEKRIELWKKTLPNFKYISYMKGEGLRDIWNKAKEGVSRAYHTVKAIITGTEARKGWSPSNKSLLRLHGRKQVVAVRIGRQPIDSFLNKILNVLSLNQFKKNLQEAGFDDAMHLFLFVKLADGNIIRCEKNEVIIMKHIESWDMGLQAEVLDIESPRTSFGEFLERSIRLVGDEPFFKYSSHKYNCQHWVKTILQANKLLTDSLEKWIMQDPEQLYKKLGYLSEIAQKLTDLASRADVSLQGGKYNRKSIKILY